MAAKNNAPIGVAVAERAREHRPIPDVSQRNRSLDSSKPPYNAIDQIIWDLVPQVRHREQEPRTLPTRRGEHPIDARPAHRVGKRPRSAPAVPNRGLQPTSSPQKLTGGTQLANDLTTGGIATINLALPV